MSAQTYSINLNIKYPPLTVIDIGKEAVECREAWFNQTLTKVNDCVVRLGILCGEFHFHKHDDEDEFFYVIEGRLLIDLENQTIELTPQQGFTIPKGIIHRTRAPLRTVVLMFEGAEVIPTGD